jgi:hypothetical protein
MLRDLHDSIVDYDLQMLRAIARARGFELKATRRAPAVDELKAHLLDGQSTDWAVSRLPEDAQEALSALLRAGGQMKAHIFSHSFGKPRAFGPGRLERERPWLEPQSPAERLWFMGLIFFTFHDVEGGHRAESVYVPSDVVPLLPETEVVLPQFCVDTADEPAVVRSEGSTFVNTIFDLLCRLQLEPASVGKDGQLTGSARQGLFEVTGTMSDRMPTGGKDSLSPAADERFGFVLHLALVAALVEVTDRKLRPRPASAREWMKWSLSRQLYHLQKTWESDATWDELRHILELLIEETGWENDPVLARRAILGHLRDCANEACPEGTWLSATSFVEAVKAVDPDFARPDGDYRSWYIRDRAAGEYLVDFASWDDVEARLIANVLAGPLYWLGAVDLGYDGEKLAAFRISSLGTALLNEKLVPTTDEAPPATLEVHPDFTVHFQPDARLYERFQVQRFASLERHSEVETVYQITRRSLAAAAEGITSRMIISFLQQHSSDPLPPNVLDGLRGWQLGG